jgi:hypothetical protein
MPKGKKCGGRKKGTPNKITFELIETLRAKGFDPAAELVQVHYEAMKLYRAKVKDNKGWGAGPALDTACKAASDLMEYVYPKRKSVELTGAEGANLFQSFTDLVKQIADGNNNG